MIAATKTPAASLERDTGKRAVFELKTSLRVLVFALKVIFDSSFLMAVSDDPTAWYDDITTELGRFEPVILDCVLKEIEGLASKRGKKGKTAKVALQLAAGFTRGRCGSSSPDDEIVSAALSEKAAVATTDDELVRTLKARRVAVVGLKAGRVALR